MLSDFNVTVTLTLNKEELRLIGLALLGGLDKKPDDRFLAAKLNHQLLKQLREVYEANAKSMANALVGAEVAVLAFPQTEKA